MSLRVVRKVVTGFNAGLRIFKFTGELKPKSVVPNLGTTISKDILLMNEQFHSLSLSKSQTGMLCLNLPIQDVVIKKQIIEPNRNVKLDFELPIKNPNKPILELPLYIEKDITDPGRVISKKASPSLVTIRRRKMKKHRRKKYMRNHKVELNTLALKKEMAREEVLQDSLRNVLNEKDDFSAEKYVQETLEKVHWKRPVTKIRGILAPQWVINEHLKKKEERELLMQRLKECGN